MCGTTGGQLNIAPTGVTEVISGGANSSATCFTSLDGASFALSSKSFTPLKLQPGWSEFDNLFRKAAARVAGGFVHLEGEIKTAGTNPAAFTLPAKFRPSRNVYVLINLCTGSIGRLNIAPSGAAGFRPAKNVYIPVDLCNGNNGRLYILPDGVVAVEAENGDFTQAQCLTSLDGASFAR